LSITQNETCDSHYNPITHEVIISTKANSPFKTIKAVLIKRVLSLPEPENDRDQERSWGAMEAKTSFDFQRGSTTTAW